MEDLFLTRSRAVHGDRYDYSRVFYVNSKTKVIIQCRTHGEFHQSPEKHWIGQGCPKCGKITQPIKKTLSQSIFLSRCREAHGDLYDYNKAVYKGKNTQVLIECSIHGYFLQKPREHWDGNGCQRCGSIKMGNSLRLTLEEFVRRSTKVHKGFYTYDEAVYINNSTKLTVRCPNHGNFETTPDPHMLGVGCPQCGITNRADAQRKDTAWFLAQATKTHGNRYDYSKSEYMGANQKVQIVCRKHGSFWQSAYSHHSGGQGCPSCFNHHTKPQKEVEEYIKELGLTVQSNLRSIIPPKELDIFLPEQKLAIEFNGVYWHSLDQKGDTDSGAHRDKFRQCKELGIQLLQIDELEWKDEVKQMIWKSIILSKLGRHRKIPARKTTFMLIDKEQAGEFLNENHLQGSTPLMSCCFGLMHEGLLVAVMTFCNSSKNRLELTRLAFMKGTTVVGGAQKLFKNALKLLPLRDIISFSSNRYSGGGIYPTLGFTKDGDPKPSYQWFFRQRVWNKRRMRHKHLSSILGPDYDPNKSESENMYRAGGRKLYDAGYQRWVYYRTTGNICTEAEKRSAFNREI